MCDPFLRLRHPFLPSLPPQAGSLNASWADRADLVLYLSTSSRVPPYAALAGSKGASPSHTGLTPAEARRMLVVLDEGDGDG